MEISLLGYGVFFTSLDNFTRSIVITMLLIGIATPYIITHNLIFSPHAASSIPAGSFVLLGTNTQATTQPTSTGKEIATLFVWNGKVYMGYGDYSVNTGPIHIMYYDTIMGQIQDSVDSNNNPFASDTEAIYNFRLMNGALYALSQDPRGSQCGYFYAKTIDGIHWQDVKGMQPMPPTSVGCPPNTTGNYTDGEHIFDMTSLTGSDIWAAGSSLGKVDVNGTPEQGIDGALWRSTDNGSTWTKMQEVAPTDYLTNPYDYTRFYVLVVLNNKLYAQARDIATGTSHSLKIFDSSTDSWSVSSVNLFPSGGNGWSPKLFAGKVVYLSNEPPSSSTIYIFDGTSVTQASFAASDLAIDDVTQTLYALSGSYLYKTTDLVNWTKLSISSMPSNGMSIAVYNNIVYIGTTDSKLYATSLTGPTVTLAPTNNPTPTSSQPPTVTPTPGPVDTTAPTVTIIYPITNTTVNRHSKINISASASDNIAVSKVEFYVNGTLTCTDATSTYNCSWSVSGKPNSTYTLTAKAYDTSGNSTISAPVIVTAN